MKSGLCLSNLIGARFYDPEIGEFISEDPAMDGKDWYEYCRSNPINYYDPDGRKGVLAKAWKYTIATVEVVGGALGVAGGYTMIAAGVITTETGLGPILGISGGTVVLVHSGNTFASGIYDFRCLLTGNDSGFGKFNWLKDNIYSKLPAGSTIYYVVDILTGIKGTASAFNSIFKGVSNVTLKGTQLSYKLGNVWKSVNITSVRVVSLTVSQRAVQGLLVIKDGVLYYIDAKGWHEVKEK